MNTPTSQPEIQSAEPQTLTPADETQESHERPGEIVDPTALETELCTLIRGIEAKLAATRNAKMASVEAALKRRAELQERQQQIGQVFKHAEEALGNFAVAGGEPVEQQDIQQLTAFVKSARRQLEEIARQITAISKNPDVAKRLRGEKATEEAESKPLAATNPETEKLRDAFDTRAESLVRRIDELTKHPFYEQAKNEDEHEADLNVSITAALENVKNEIRKLSALSKLKPAELNGLVEEVESTLTGVGLDSGSETQFRARLAESQRARGGWPFGQWRKKAMDGILASPDVTRTTSVYLEQVRGWKQFKAGAREVEIERLRLIDDLRHLAMDCEEADTKFNTADMVRCASRASLQQMLKALKMDTQANLQLFNRIMEPVEKFLAS